MPEITLLAAVSKKRSTAGCMSDTSTHATTQTHRWAQKQGSIFIVKKVLVSKDQCLVNCSRPITDPCLFQALADTHSETLERLLVAPGQLKCLRYFLFSYFFFFFTSNLDCLHSRLNKNLTEVSLQCNTGIQCECVSSNEKAEHIPACSF